MYQAYNKQSRDRSHRFEKKRDLILPEEGQEFGHVEQMLGNGRLRVMCEDGNILVGRIRGSMKRGKNKVIVSNNDLVIICRRDFEEDKVDVLHRYTPEEVAIIIRKYEVPEKIRKALNTTLCGSDDENDDGDLVTFAYEDDTGTSGCDKNDMRDINIDEI